MKRIALSLWLALLLFATPCWGVNWDTDSNRALDYAHGGLNSTSLTEARENLGIASGAFDTGVLKLDTLADLQSYTGAATVIHVLDWNGQPGTVQYRAGDYESECDADTLNAVYVQKSGVATTTGVMVRVGFNEGLKITPQLFGAKADWNGVSGTDNSTALQAWIDFAEFHTSPIQLTLPVGSYYYTTGLTIVSDCITIIGEGSPSVGRGSESSSTTRGATLRYSGTGTGLLIGNNPDVDGTWLRKARIENVRIEVDDDTAIAMRCWMLVGCLFENIAIFGHKGNANIGLRVEGGVNNVYERIDIQAHGQTTAATPADYGIALSARLGYNNDPITTTVFRDCYFHYAYRAAEIDYVVNFEYCIFEASYRGVHAVSYMNSTFERCWWEANEELDVYFGNTNSQSRFNRCKFNSYSRQTYFNSGSGFKHVTFLNTEFGSSNAAPILFATSNNVTRPAGDGWVNISGCEFDANTTFGGAGYSTYPYVRRPDTNLVVYRFVENSVAAGTTYNPMSRADGVTGNAYVMPSGGNIIGVNVYYSSTMTAGTFDIGTKIDGVNVADYSYPAQPLFSASPQHKYKDVLSNWVEQGDELTVYLHTDASFAPTGGSFVYEVLVQHGQSPIL